MNKYWPDKDLFFVDKLAVNKDIAPRGIASKLIVFLLNKSGSTFLCGDAVTPDGLKFWQNFTKNTGIVLRLFDNESGRFYTLDEVDNKRIFLPENDIARRFFYATS